jgi:hypothetical protein
LVAINSTAANSSSDSASSSSVAASPAAPSVVSVSSRRSKKDTLEACKEIEKKNTELVNKPSLPGSLFIGLGGLNLGNLCSYIEVNTQTRASTISRVLVPFCRDKRHSTEVYTPTLNYLILFNVLYRTPSP